MMRRRAVFTGNVQGVGFRFTAERIAEEFEVTGFVRNLEDGRVEIVAEGAEEEVARFIDAVHDRMRDHIDDVQSSDTPTPGHFERFEVRY